MLQFCVFVNPAILTSPPPVWSRISDPTASQGTEGFVLAGFVALYGYSRPTSQLLLEVVSSHTHEDSVWLQGRWD